jgi:NAD(P)-dependent dehydrogenase (short-subunit alcohol dehydrogenase family)
MKSLKDKIALVTGATSGIGEATALLYAQHGAKVVVSGRREDRGQNVVDKITNAGGSAIFVRSDVKKREDIEGLVTACVDHFGGIDCAVNNAGITGPGLTALADIEEDDWDELIDVNLKAVWMCMKYQIPAMLKSGGGSIVNVSSIYGYKPGELGNAPYVTSKHGVIALSKTAAIDYGQQGIRVNAVSPGFTHSEMVDPYLVDEPDLMKKVISNHSAQNRVGESKEVAEAIIWLSSDEASFVNGAVLTTDGGPTSRLY